MLLTLPPKERHGQTNKHPLLFSSLHPILSPGGAALLAVAGANRARGNGDDLSLLGGVLPRSGSSSSRGSSRGGGAGLCGRGLRASSAKNGHRGGRGGGGRGGGGCGLGLKLENLYVEALGKMVGKKREEKEEVSTRRRAIEKCRSCQGLGDRRAPCPVSDSRPPSCCLPATTPRHAGQEDQLE